MTGWPASGESPAIVVAVIKDFDKNERRFNLFFMRLTNLVVELQAEVLTIIANHSVSTSMRIVYSVQSLENLEG